MKPAQYIFINKGLGMSAGKIAAQASHAAVLSTNWSKEYEPKLYEAWMGSGHYPKYILEARDEIHLHNIYVYLLDRNFEAILVIDEGHTEVPPFSATALGVGLVDKDDKKVSDIFSEFKLYKEDSPKEWTFSFGPENFKPDFPNRIGDHWDHHSAHNPSYVADTLWGGDRHGY